MSGRPIAKSTTRAPAAPAMRPQSPASALAAEIKALVRGRRARCGPRAVRRAGGAACSVAGCASRITICAMRPTPTKPCRMRSSRCFCTSSSTARSCPFDVWFMRILVNACLDRLKSRSRQQRWIAEPARRRARRAAGGTGGRHRAVERASVAGAGAVAAGARRRWPTLPDRQRLVFTLSHLDERTAAEISEATGMSPATVRVHLFRAIRKLRALLGEQK